MGFLRFAHALFLQLDTVGDGTLEHRDLFEAAHIQPDSDAMRRLLVALDELIPASNRPRRLHADEVLADSLKAANAATLWRNIKRHLDAHGACVADLALLLDEQKGVQLRLLLSEWKKAMTRLGYGGGSASVLEQV